MFQKLSLLLDLIVLAHPTLNTHSYPGIPWTPARDSETRICMLPPRLSPFLTPFSSTILGDGRNRISSSFSFLSLSFLNHIPQPCLPSPEATCEEWLAGNMGEKNNMHRLTMLNILPLAHLHSFLFIEHMVSKQSF